MFEKGKKRGLFIIFLLALLALTASLGSADESSIVLDGVRDVDYVQIASDPAGDLASPGPADWSGTAWTDLTALYVAADSSTLFVYVDLPDYVKDIPDPGNDSSGQIGLALDVDGNPNSGGKNDPWANAITFAYNTVDGFAGAKVFLPDYVIRGNVSNDGGHTELRTWNGNWDTGAGINWGGISGGDIGTQIAYAHTQGVELAIPLADIGSPAPANVRLQFFTTQGGGSKGAFDTVASDNQATGWDTPTTQEHLVTVPLAIDPAGDLASPGPADWSGVAWTDMTRLHIWADDANLFLYVPSEAYDSTVSTGQLGLALDTKAGGGSYDPWGNAITYDYQYKYQNLGSTAVVDPDLPDYLIRGNIYGPGDNGWTELRTWNGSWDTGGGADWGGIGNTGSGSVPGSKVSWTSGEGLRLRIPFSDIGVAANDTLSLQFFGTQGGGGKGAYDTVPSDDQSTGWDDPTTQQYQATYVIPEIDPGGAGHDNDIWWDDLGHDSRDSKYRTPGGPVTTNTPVTLRLRAASNDLTAAKLRIWDDVINAQQILDMTRVADDGTHEWWEATVPASVDTTIFWYRFIPIDGTATAYYEDDESRSGGWGKTYGDSPDHSWQLTVYDPAFQTPDWAKDGIMYQIFPDRFRDGDGANDTPPGSFFYEETPTIVRSNDPAENWNGLICDPRDAGSDCPDVYSQNFYGGDLQGIVDKLDNLQELGVTVLYFNPVFESPSNHKYDTTDYEVIDDNFGDLALFQTLVDEAHSRGMHVVLDGVFNHTSSDSIYFDRYGRYAPPDGACESETSTYRDWYYFRPAGVAGEGVCAGDTDYEAWFGFDSLPKLDSGNQDVRDLIWDTPGSVALYWMQYADGWRFDVGADIDPGRTNDPNNDYWEGLRAAVHSVNPDAYLVIEEWGNASPWLLGQEMDATMNYQYSSAMLSFWRDSVFEDNDHNAGSSAGKLVPLTPSQLDARLNNWKERYPPEAYYAMMNLLGSHDTNRALFMLDHNAAVQMDDSLLEDPNYDWSDAITRLKGVVLLQMTLPGAPTIYYGDEVGQVGPTYVHGGRWEDDPYNRVPYPWLDESGTPFYTHLQTEAGQNVLRDFYMTLAGTRNAHAALRTGSFDTLLVDDTENTYVYGRLLADYSDAAVVFVNRDTAAQEISVDVAGYLPVGAQFEDALNGGLYTVDGSGLLTVPNVPAMNGAVLVATGALGMPPDAVIDLAVVGVGSNEVDLIWSAASGAGSYDVYRSLVSGGGYEFVANTSGTTFTDSGLATAVAYYYVVISRDDLTLLASERSNEVEAVPAHDLSSAWFNLQWPPSINHTISTSTRTENIYGQIWIDGATSAPGPTEGLLAQVGYGPDGATPDDSWNWEVMAFNGDVGNNDEFVGSFLPDMLGTYDYVTRYSSDGARTWYYADLNGPGINGNPGDLVVIPSSDTTLPDAPANLMVTGTSSSSISMSWDANSEADLAGYEIYREDTAAPGYSRIASLGAGTTSFDDQSVTTGNTYNYYVLAFDTSFNRSDPSNVIEATAVRRHVSVTFTVGVPDYTPGTVYIVGDIPEFGPWNPSLVAMTQVDDNTWTHTVDILDGTQMQYKYTRGNWDTVESWGSIIVFNNRNLTIEYGGDGTQLVDNTATDWGTGPDDEKAVRYWRDPLVVDHMPADGATRVPLETTIDVVWSIPMEADTTFNVEGAQGAVPGSFAYDGGTQTVTFTPDNPLVLGETYTVTVTGAVSVGVEGGDSGTQQVPVIFSFATISIQDQIEDLMDEVDQLVDDGVLNQGRGTALNAKLAAAIESLDIGNTRPAIRQLNAFINQVNALIQAGRLTPADGHHLIVEAWAILAQLEQPGSSLMAGG